MDMCDMTSEACESQDSKLALSGYVHVSVCLYYTHQLLYIEPIIEKIALLH